LLLPSTHTSGHEKQEINGKWRKHASVNMCDGGEFPRSEELQQCGILRYSPFSASMRKGQGNCWISLTGATVGTRTPLKPLLNTLVSLQRK